MKPLLWKALLLSAAFHVFFLFLIWFLSFSLRSPLAGGGYGGGGGGKTTLRGGTKTVLIDIVETTPPPPQDRAQNEFVLHEKKKKPQKKQEKSSREGSEIPGPAGSGIGTGIGTGVGPGTGPGSGLEGHDPILAEIRNRIERAKRYPLLARQMGITGKSLVHFQIDPSGQPSEITLKTSSGRRILDDEALATIRRAAPYPYYEKPLEIWISFEIND